MIKTDLYSENLRSGGRYLSRPESLPGKAPGSAEKDSARDAGESAATEDQVEIGAGQQLTPEEKRELEELRKADREVRQHERAHLAAAAGLSVSGAQFTMEMGPDGKLYAVAGEVRIDASEVPDDPRATIDKMQRVRRAALAPRDPSAQDRRVAAEAQAREIRARIDLRREQNSADNSTGRSYNETDKAIGNVVDVVA